MIVPLIRPRDVEAFEASIWVAVYAGAFVKANSGSTGYVEDAIKAANIAVDAWRRGDMELSQMMDDEAAFRAESEARRPKSKAKP